MCARADTIAVLFVMHAPVHKTNLVRLEACPMPVKDAKRESERVMRVALVLVGGQMSVRYECAHSHPHQTATTIIILRATVTTGTRTHCMFVLASVSELCCFGFHFN